jgi:tetratricopeptide (TPR) repeat protein
MHSRRCLYFFLLASTLGFASTKAKPVASFAKDTLPVTTSSVEARKFFDRAMRRYEDYRLGAALEDLRLATKMDPKFAQAYILTARLSRDPGEQETAREEAKQVAPGASSGEQLLVRWLSNAQENNCIPAIAAMNDLLEKYPDDQRLDFMAGDWLNGQHRYEQAIMVLEHALKLNPNYPAALNDVAYAYAYGGDFPKAFAAMDRYVALEPDEPNAHDSYGEILRMAGKLDAALEQYRQSIRLDPTFGSEIGVADTYALMGREQDARDEYERAEVFASTSYDKISFELQAALTWIRDNNRKQAEKALLQVAHHAQAAGLVRLEAEPHRILGMYETNPQSALKHLDDAEAALAENHPISSSDRDYELARILKVRAVRLTDAQDFNSAEVTVKHLQTMAENSRGQTIQLCWHGAAGAVLEARGKHAEAIPHLEEDSQDPLSLRFLAKAYSKTGATSQAEEIAARLSSVYVPSAEQALVVSQPGSSPVIRASQP